MQVCFNKTVIIHPVYDLRLIRTLVIAMLSYTLTLLLGLGVVLNSTILAPGFDRDNILIYFK